ncbi:hypothetical protein Q4519_12500 [Motilimonas sp. 1_MG-2023]|uniref:hypothetical protein n=1 Tax=Motilimonas sp. 1_MG-2023 TaxID=3062672 RepID=UPI0026E36713|nr:hypothetical protein [Motilimonas sp. 1_MG-2023]MDO6526504.1 hypothetical protein [Motilimonas sp. 1_MG-2023]
MNPAIKKLKQYLEELEATDSFATVEEKAEHFGLIIQVRASIGQLELCEKFEIHAGSLVSVLPETGDIHTGYLAVCDNESSNSEYWEEVLFDGRQVQFSSGDLIIRK